MNATYAYPCFFFLEITVLEVMILGGCGIGRFDMSPFLYAVDDTRFDLALTG